MRGTLRQSMRAAVHRWWTGDLGGAVYDPTGKNPAAKRSRYHWTSWLAHKLLGFLGREWKWVAGFAVAVAGLVIAAVR